jgi:AP-3 complex subunit delta-1
MDEIKHEIRGGDMDVKAEAVLKLSYLQMLGYAPSNASFHMLEVMASPRYHLKQVGYMAASQCFTQDTEVLILATNMIKKDLRSPSPLDVAVALNGLSHIITPDLAQHLAPDVSTLLTHSKATIRKRALLVLHAIVLQYPPALEQCLGRLSDRLQDADPGVVSSAVNIICELSRRDETIAKAFLPLSPQLFELLTTSTNNWMLIKVVKLFGILTPLEPRLAKRLLPPITTLIHTTPAMSLLYECMHTVIIGGMLNDGATGGGEDLARLCSDKLGIFLGDEDQNLRYIALLALVKLLPTHPHLVALHQDAIFDSMNDEDLTIRLRSLDLVSGMAGRSNFMDIVDHQLGHLDPQMQSRTAAVSSNSAADALRKVMQKGSNDPQPTVLEAPSWITASYRAEIVKRILDLGSAETYTNIVDFEWYVDTLIKLNQLDGERFGNRIQEQLIDVAVRVRAVRGHAIQRMKVILEDASFACEQEHGSQSLQIYRAAAWICGEYCQEVPYAPAIIELLIHKNVRSRCDHVTLAMLVQNAVKLLAWYLLDLSEKWTKDSSLEEAEKLTQQMLDALYDLAAVDDVEVRERVKHFVTLLSILQQDLNSFSIEEGNKFGPKSLQLLSPLFFAYPLGPVSKKAQAKVTLPEGLDLNVWFVEPGQYTVNDQLSKHEQTTKRTVAKSKRKEHVSIGNGATNPKQDNQQHVIGHSQQSLGKSLVDDDIDAIPIVQLQLDPPQQATGKAKTLAPIIQEPEEEPEETATTTGEVQQVVRKSVGGKGKKRRAARQA